MIVPNLMVSNIRRSLLFYTEIVGMREMMALDPSNMMVSSATEGPLCFVTLGLGEAQLMLQTEAHFRAALPSEAPPSDLSFSGSLYFRAADPEGVALRAASSTIVKGVETSWYGMKELWIRDPDGYLLCLARPDEAARPATGEEEGRH
ncbi:Glyoxalase/bleomycin resistance protein/dioxygenase [Parvularcula bermudensis HTCC2503]|uniref:Glyoxalase/bleomycin resistance protein/dioxygenase n=1 Tax=Parvularcula bermudensis (strain ATCC BAA-594 / HTCC2503 / KCTC 12087) TaxID=314260 RepID=E0TE78_PARBH|nr:VOC family protein [Parvularcula bermudensis]ADM09453.1 Glyoxalase/bleomycin resistance protein/dioxygenase [Parvularcula bermudensis HTCC2503]